MAELGPADIVENKSSQWTVNEKQKQKWFTVMGHTITDKAEELRQCWMNTQLFTWECKIIMKRWSHAKQSLVHHAFRFRRKNRSFFSVFFLFRVKKWQRNDECGFLRMITTFVTVFFIRFCLLSVAKVSNTRLLFVWSSGWKKEKEENLRRHRQQHTWLCILHLLLKLVADGNS